MVPKIALLSVRLYRWTIWSTDNKVVPKIALLSFRLEHLRQSFAQNCTFITFIIIVLLSFTYNGTNYILGLVGFKLINDPWIDTNFVLGEDLGLPVMPTGSSLVDLGLLSRPFPKKVCFLGKIK